MWQWLTCNTRRNFSMPIVGPCWTEAFLFQNDQNISIPCWFHGVICQRTRGNLQMSAGHFGCPFFENCADRSSDRPRKLIGMPIGMTFSFPVGLKSIIAHLRLTVTLNGMHHGTMAFTTGMLCVLHCTEQTGVKLEGNRLPCQPSRQPFGETRVGGGASSVEC